jgi:hypothetical protein
MEEKRGVREIGKKWKEDVEDTNKGPIEGGRDRFAVEGRQHGASEEHGVVLLPVVVDFYGHRHHAGWYLVRVLQVKIKFNALNSIFEILNPMSKFYV